jgi:hypothetical protein
MPNHMHGIIVISEVGTAPRGRPYPGIENGQARGLVPTGRLSLSDVIERFKSLTTIYGGLRGVSPDLIRYGDSLFFMLLHELHGDTKPNQ